MAGGIYFDGTSSARKPVLLTLAADALEIAAADDDAPLAQWPYAELVSLSAPDGLLRVARKGGGLARLEIRDGELMAALDTRAGGIDRSGKIGRRTRRKVIAWSLGAVVSTTLVGVLGVPVIADRLAPLVPRRVELRLGATIDRQIRSALTDRSRTKPLQCGGAAAQRAGAAALTRLVGRLDTAAGVGMPIKVDVLDLPMINAFALPGGYIHVFRGLIDKAESTDELAGIIAHEIGHVAHRDSTRAILQSAGLSFLFGMVFGDFSGGVAVVIATRTVLQSSYSRDTEMAADLYGANLMSKVGGEPRALGAILVRIAGAPGGLADFLLDHPAAQERAATIDTVARPAATVALLAPAEWTALKQICADK